VSDLGAPVAGEVATGAPALGETLDRSQWLAWRRTGIGASDVAPIVGLSPWGSAFSVFVDKVTDLDDDDDPADHMILGLDLEPVVARWYERRHPGLHVIARQQRATHPEHRWALATLDGLVVEEGTDDPGLALAVFESKYDAGVPWDEIPLHYQCQAQWSMFVTGLDHAFIATLHMAFGRPNYRTYELGRDEATIAMLYERAEAFWFGNVVAGVPPAADGSQATTDALAAAWPDPVAVPAVDVGELADLIDEWQAFKDAERRLKSDIRAHENEIKRALGNHTEGCVGGQVVVSWRPQGRTDIDRDAVRADHGDKYDTHGTVRVLRPHTPKAPVRRTA